KRATLAFTAACSAAAGGTPTCVFLVGDGTCWSLEDATEGVRHDGYAPLETLITDFVDLGGEILACTEGSPSAIGQRQRLRPEVLPRDFHTVLANIGHFSSISF
ncbi:MAG: hypothetical protein ABFS23_00115, partial [Pseudomonadota bacterium]